MTGDFADEALRHFLEADPRIERVPADTAYACTVLDALPDDECDLALYAAARGRWTKANTLTYDAARKAVEAPQGASRGRVPSSRRAAAIGRRASRVRAGQRADRQRLGGRLIESAMSQPWQRSAGPRTEVVLRDPKPPSMGAEVSSSARVIARRGQQTRCRRPPRDPRPRADRGLDGLMGPGASPGQTPQLVLHWSRAGDARMANLTLTIDDDALKRARIRALDEGTSINALVRDYIQRYARDQVERAALQELVDVAKRSTASSGHAGRTWTRDDLYDR